MSFCEPQVAERGPAGRETSGSNRRVSAARPARPRLAWLLFGASVLLGLSGQHGAAQNVMPGYGPGQNGSASYSFTIRRRWSPQSFRVMGEMAGGRGAFRARQCMQASQMPFAVCRQMINGRMSKTYIMPLPPPALSVPGQMPGNNAYAMPPSPGPWSPGAGGFPMPGPNMYPGAGSRSGWPAVPGAMPFAPSGAWAGVPAYRKTPEFEMSGRGRWRDMDITGHIRIRPPSATNW